MELKNFTAFFLLAMQREPNEAGKITYLLSKKNFLSRYPNRVSSNSTDVGANGNHIIGKPYESRTTTKTRQKNFQSPLFPQKSRKNRTIIQRTVLIESVLSKDSHIQ